MICQFSFKNFKSYRDETVFDLQATALPEFADTLIGSPKASDLLPVSVIYGPNGGGKSMFVDIITGKHPLLGDSIKYDFAPSTKEYISDNIKYVCFKDTYGGDNDSTYYLQQRWNQTEIDPETATVGSRLEAAYQAAGDDTE